MAGRDRKAQSVAYALGVRVRLNLRRPEASKAPSEAAGCCEAAPRPGEPGARGQESAGPTPGPGRSMSDRGPGALHAGFLQCPAGCELHFPVLSGRQGICDLLSTEELPT